MSQNGVRQNRVNKDRMHQAGRASLFLLIVIAMLLTSGCAKVFDKEIRKAAVEVSFQELQRNTDEYVGKVVIFGGYVLNTRNQEDQSAILVLQAPLDSGYSPGARENSRGRFLVVDQGFLDPEIYKEGREITVAGEVIGREMTKIDNFNYPLVKLKAIDMRLWREVDERYPYRYYYEPYYPWPDPYYRYHLGPYRPYYW